jgi:hypothetical protein
MRPGARWREACSTSSRSGGSVNGTSPLFSPPYPATPRTSPWLCLKFNYCVKIGNLWTEVTRFCDFETEKGRRGEVVLCGGEERRKVGIYKWMCFFLFSVGKEFISENGGAPSLFTEFYS